jgi:hypothetical protein
MSVLLRRGFRILKNPTKFDIFTAKHAARSLSIVPGGRFNNAVSFHCYEENVFFFYFQVLSSIDLIQ